MGPHALAILSLISSSSPFLPSHPPLFVGPRLGTPLKEVVGALVGAGLRILTAWVTVTLSQWSELVAWLAARFAFSRAWKPVTGSAELKKALKLDAADTAAVGAVGGGDSSPGLGQSSGVKTLPVAGMFSNPVRARNWTSLRLGGVRVRVRGIGRVSA